MKKEDEWMRRESIHWAQVLEDLGPKFTEHDIKKVLCRGSKRTLNINAPFRRMVQEELTDKLGELMTVEVRQRSRAYTISDLPEALKRLGKKPKRTISAEEESLERIHFLEEQKEIALEKEKEAAEKEASEKLRENFLKFLNSGTPKRTKKSLRDCLVFLALYCREEKKVLNLITIREGFNMADHAKKGRPLPKDKIDKISKFLSEAKISIRENDSRVEIETEKLLDTYLWVQDVYGELYGETPRELDSLISSEKRDKDMGKPQEQEKPKKDRLKETMEILEKAKELQKEKRREETTNTKWKKWLLLQSLKALPGHHSYTTYTEWVEKHRGEIIPEEQAKKFFRELKEDSEGIKIDRMRDMVSLDGPTPELIDIYHPKYITEVVYIKTRLTPEEIRRGFPSLKCKVDESIQGGYIYSLNIDRTFEVEQELITLVRILRISGRIYNPESFMIQRVMKLIESQDKEARLKASKIKGLE